MNTEMMIVTAWSVAVLIIILLVIRWWRKAYKDDYLHDSDYLINDFYTPGKGK